MDTKLKEAVERVRECVEARNQRNPGSHDNIYSTFSANGIVSLKASDLLALVDAVRVQHFVVIHNDSMEAPEAPCHYNNAEASAWQSGWESGRDAASANGAELAHQWNDDGEKCVRCGASDWMAGGCTATPAQATPAKPCLSKFATAEEYFAAMSQGEARTKLPLDVDTLIAILEDTQTRAVAGYMGACERVVSHDGLLEALTAYRDAQQ
jgi:hypothetical protein